MTWTVDVAHHRRAANVTSIVDDDVAESEQALRDIGGNSDVLDFAQRNVSGGAGNQARVDLQLGVGDRVPHHVSTDVVVAGNQ